MKRKGGAFRSCRRTVCAIGSDGSIQEIGGVDGTRTRDPRRDRPVF